MSYGQFIKAVYGNVTLLDLTPDVCAKYLPEIAPADIKKFKRDGAKYCVERDSFIYPPERCR